MGTAASVAVTNVFAVPFISVTAFAILVPVLNVTLVLLISSTLF